MQKYSCCSHAKYICSCIYGAEMLPKQPLGIGHSHHSAELPGPLDGIHHVKATNRDKGSLLEEVGELHSTQDGHKLTIGGAAARYKDAVTESFQAKVILPNECHNAVL
eukprot:TRINITY_DN164_c0_g1_i2.p1 TRINITY_DN164_c0_g1~~TRINITY_DN164_c0_g1_i2.p1  ORF type:complete len:115 (-),score=3.03 TRINITY_DN164_c0_g1_i2:311-634(-)